MGNSAYKRAEAAYHNELYEHKRKIDARFCQLGTPPINVVVQTEHSESGEIDKSKDVVVLGAGTTAGRWAMRNSAAALVQKIVQISDS